MTQYEAYHVLQRVLQYNMQGLCLTAACPHMPLTWISTMHVQEAARGSLML
jgi:hypothetical protein